MKAKRILRFVVAVKDLGCKVETVRPHDGAGFQIDAYRGEEIGIIEGPNQGAFSLSWYVRGNARWNSRIRLLTRGAAPSPGQ